MPLSHTLEVTAMKARLFHHPDLSLPVIARRAEAELIDALMWYGDLLLSRGRSAWRSQLYRSNTAYWNAVRRLRRTGVVAYRRKGGAPPVLRVDPIAADDRAAHHPERWWGRRWSGIWYVLVYDVPEKQRRNRDHLRRILVRERCGCLQNSVWISPKDLRPIFDDLSTAAAIDNIAHLFEARTVLGMGPVRLVREAWDFDRLERLHDRLRADYEQAMADLSAGRVARAAVAPMARDAAFAWRQAVAVDPLLPTALHPPEYRGPELFERHRALMAALRKYAERA